MGNDKNLFDEIFHKNRDRVYRLCCMYTGDADARKDLMQDIFIRVWENLGSFRGEAAMSTWIYRIALNTCLTHVRSLKKDARVSRMPGNFDIADSESAGDNTPDMDAFIRAVNQLPVYERALITLYLEDLSGKEIADITGLSEANVRVKIHRIKERLSELTKVVTVKEACHEF
jgi:RNA polymerase sigma-70 factor (ECF subfamily)